MFEMLVDFSNFLTRPMCFRVSTWETAWISHHVSLEAKCHLYGV